MLLDHPKNSYHWIDYTTDGFLFLSSEFTIINLNKTAEILLNCEKILLNGHSIFHLPEPVEKLFPENFQKWICSNNRQNPIKSHSEKKSFLWQCIPQISIEGSVEYFAIIVRDLTLQEQYISNNKLLADFTASVTGQKIIDFENHIESARSIYEYLEGIIAILPGSVYWMNKEHIYLGCNESMRQLLKLPSRQDFVGKTYHELYDKVSSAIYQKADHEVMTTGISISAEEPLSFPDGSKRIYLSNKVPIFAKDGSIIGMLGISIDITDRKKWELAEKKLKVMAENNNQLMQTLAAAVSHEIRTPLSVISACLDNLEKIIKEDNPKIKDYFKKLKRVIKGAATLTRMVLTNLRIAASSKVDKRHFKNCSMRNTVLQTLEDYPFKEDERELVYWEEAEEDFFYLGDATLTQHILMNLLKNAFEAIKEARKGKIEISFNTTRKRVNELIFKDTALGIPTDIQEKLFTQFQSTKSMGTGTGLGLTFCRLIMQAYGGEIVCQSVEGKYTKFILRFPK